MNYGKVEVSKTSPFLSQVDQKTSPYLQEKLIYIGQEMCYENGAQAVELLLNIKSNDTAIYRMTDKMGESLEDTVRELEYQRKEEVKDDEVVYSQVDGSMLLTRELGWKETKLGRVFKGSSILQECTERKWIRRSEYVAHLGCHTEFENSMSKILDNYSHLKERLVFINDGAKWIHNWISSEYPNALQILDFYHAIEHISDYSRLCIIDKAKRQKWIKETSNVLKQKGYEQTINRIEELKSNTKKKKEAKEKLMNYLEGNKERMDYPMYISKGLLIGSGAIESAHRNVLQKRLKQSGQRWSTRGLKNIIGLRVLNKSDHWHLIRDKLKNVA